MKPLATQGIILRRTNYGEADRIIAFLTRDYGRIRVMAKGVRKSKSKLAGGIELFSVSELHFIRGRGDIGTLVSTRLIKHYGNIVKDLARTEAAYAMLKVIDKTVEDDAGEDYFVVLLESLAALDDARIGQPLAELSFAMRLLQLGGHVPDFTTDTAGKKLEKDVKYEYDFESVSFHSSPDGNFNKNHLKLLRLLAHNSPQAMAAVQGISKYLEDLTSLVRTLAAQYLPT